MRLFNKESLTIGALFIWLIGPGPLHPFRIAWMNKTPPQLILVLGGDIDRERMGAKIALEKRLPLILSGGSNPEHANWLMAKAGIPSQQVTLDYRAQDTLTNFTSLVDELKEKETKHILLITSEDHLSRAISLGNIIAGSRGIKLTSLSVPCVPNCKKEGWSKQVIDLTRAWIWVATGRDLKLLAPKVLEERITNNINNLHSKKRD